MNPVYPFIFIHQRRCGCSKFLQSVSEPLGLGAVVAGVAGVGSGIHGAVKMKEANDTINMANSRHEKILKSLRVITNQQVKGWMSWVN